MTPFNFQLMLWAIVVIVWIWSGIKPRDRRTWFLESIVAAIVTPTAYIIGRRAELSDFSFGLMTVFLLLYIFGTHYTFIETPLGRTVGRLFGSNRNVYDRVVHFSSGLLFTYPFYELVKNMTFLDGFWVYYTAFVSIMMIAAIWEIFEWLRARSLPQDLAEKFLGFQGDIWDTQKDMAVAAIGSAVALLFIFLVKLF